MLTGFFKKKKSLRYSEIKVYYRYEHEGLFRLCIL